MSRTPIREAIMSLIDSGILERTATKVVVKSITLTDITEILQVREAIEQKAASIIIEAAGLSAAQEKEFSEIHMELLQNVTSGNFSKNFQTDELFHRKLIEFSGQQQAVGHCRASLAAVTASALDINPDAIPLHLYP